jgi:acetyltransferase-like isoleucine patch superfamily enzyme
MHMNIKAVAQQIRSAIHRRTDPEGYARSIGVTVGSNCRLIDVSFSTEPYLIRIGNHVSATKTRFETHDGGVWVFRDEDPDLDIVKGITVGNNVYFGYGCVVMPGVNIGSNVVIGAGSIVTRDIPDGSVAVGVPARVIKTTTAYYAKARQSGQPTKRMDPASKKSFYLGEDK